MCLGHNTYFDLCCVCVFHPQKTSWVAILLQPTAMSLSINYDLLCGTLQFPFRLKRSHNCGLQRSFFANLALCRPGLPLVAEFLGHLEFQAKVRRLVSHRSYASPKMSRRIDLANDCVVISQPLHFHPSPSRRATCVYGKSFSFISIHFICAILALKPRLCFHLSRLVIRGAPIGTTNTVKAYCDSQRFMAALTCCLPACRTTSSPSSRRASDSLSCMATTVKVRNW